ncbi:unnamed protein product [Anisakis simplex]|uniref:Transmembrane protein n=1 Tax=Anisakis simplex TaxID=6269 RepID=A0A158PN93_ANISI|nr:unnamed protein product [Anisakis simplex]
MITQFWADEGNSSSPFLVLFIFQLFILAVALILLATGHDAWFSFVFAQLVLFMGIAELTTSAFVALRDTRFERCREFGCTIVKGSTFLRSRFISASALCGIFHTAIGFIYLILGPHCHDTPEPTIIISRDLITRLRNKISSVSRSGSTLHEMSRSPELNELADNQTLSQRCATTLSSATLRVPSESNDHSKLPYVLRVLERAKEIDSKNRLHEPLYNHAVLTSTTQVFFAVLADSSVSLSADRLSATLNECLRRDEGVALAEAAHENWGHARRTYTWNFVWLEKFEGSPELSESAEMRGLFGCQEPHMVSPFTVSPIVSCGFPIDIFNQRNYSLS